MFLSCSRPARLSIAAAWSTDHDGCHEKGFRDRISRNPYYGYAGRIEGGPRNPITAKLVADLIAAAGASRVLSVDLHAGQIQGFFNIPVDNLFATPVLLEYVKKNITENTVIVSPDTGRVERGFCEETRGDFGHHR